MKKHYYLFSLIVPVTIFISVHFHGYLSFTALIISFMVLPALELVLPSVMSNLSIEEEISRKNDRYFDFILWLSLPAQYGLLFYYCYQISILDLAAYEFLGMTTAMGIGCGVLGINAAHELGHRNNVIEQTMAKMLLSTSFYWHFFIEHNKGHHKYVSTPHDSASARLNESLYPFYWRSIKGSFLSAWEIEKLNCHRQGFKHLSLQNEMIKAMLLQLVLPFSIYFIFGPSATLGFLMSALMGILLLEAVNYIEHYGLERREIAPNRFEKVQVWHSWNANNPISRAVLFDLSRHSDHHANVNIKYQNLKNYDQSPQLPTGYPGMVLLTLIPPLWFKLMNKKIFELNKERSPVESA